MHASPERDPLEAARAYAADFERPGQLEASVYRDTLFALASAFAGPSFNVTHSEYTPRKGEERGKVDICLEFLDPAPPEEQADDYSYHTQQIDAFLVFLRTNLSLIPAALRRDMDGYVGFNYGDAGGIIIRAAEVSRISQEEYMAVQSEYRIGYGRDLEAMNRLEVLRDEIRERIGRLTKRGE